MHICIVCSVNTKKPCPPMRMCTETEKMFCTICKIPDTVVKVNMLGRILRICNMSCYMCPMCLQFNEWRGDGTDLRCEVDGWTRCECTPRQMYPCEEQRSLRSEKACAVCATKHACTACVQVVSSNASSLDNIFLCTRHMPHQHMLRNVFDRRSLERAVAYRMKKALSNTKR